MTEQEAEALAERLERVWAPESSSWSFVAKDFSFCGELAGGVSFQFYKDRRWSLSATFWGRSTGGRSRIYLSFGADGRQSTGPQGDKETLEQFTSEWLPVFRRGCWLSGCPIEASAHEKAEWMQGFTQDEVEAWNLKM